MDFRIGTSAIGASFACKEACTASSDAFAALMINQCSLLRMCLQLDWVASMFLVWLLREEKSLPDMQLV